MIRHIFLAPIKSEVDKSAVDKVLEQMRDFAWQIPEVQAVSSDYALGYLGDDQVIVMQVDLENQAAFEAFLTNPYHQKISQKADDLFKIDDFVTVQIKLKED